MVIRIVRMTFQPASVQDFLAFFQEIYPVIRQMPGCRHLVLWQDVENPSVFSTYSHWETAEDLERYRQSEYFRRTWAQTKTLFAAPPQAWSHIQAHPLP